jgi:hypothetical protein
LGKGHFIQGEICHELLELSIFLFQDSQPPEFGDSQSSVMPLPSIEGHFGDADLAADFGDTGAALDSFESGDDLSFSKGLSGHSLPLSGFAHGGLSAFPANARLKPSRWTRFLEAGHRRKRRGRVNCLQRALPGATQHSERTGRNQGTL